MRFARMGRAAAVLAAAMAFTGAVAEAAEAVTFIGQDIPTTVTIARGATGMVPWTYKNTGGPGSLPASGMQVVFTAPGSTTFTAQSTIPSQYSSDGSAWLYNNVGLRKCALSNAATRMTCEGYGINGGPSGWPSGGYFRFWPQVTVAASAPAGTTLPRGRGTLAYTDPSSGTSYTISDGTLSVATPAARAARAGMCLDVLGNGIANGTNVQIYQCRASQPNQQWVIDGGRVIRAGTVGTISPMCLSSGNTRNNGDNVLLWACTTAGNGPANQTWVVQGGKVILKNTMGTSSPMCLSSGNTRTNGTNVVIWRCVTAPANANANQTWVVQGGAIKLADTV